MPRDTATLSERENICKLGIKREHLTKKTWLRTSIKEHKWRKTANSRRLSLWTWKCGRGIVLCLFLEVKKECYSDRESSHYWPLSENNAEYGFSKWSKTKPHKPSTLQQIFSCWTQNSSIPETFSLGMY